MARKAFDVSSIRLKLRHMVDEGYVTLEQLDEPSPGFRSNMNVHMRDFPKGYRGVRHQNLLRIENILPPAK
jgi:hypothetical protein|tara:strand:- start:232 stop:444 length:213 start_codon:yes stop_codon:yes gene_type:complete